MQDLWVFLIREQANKNGSDLYISDCKVVNLSKVS